MTDEDNDLGETTLHLAGTRPAMVPIIDVPWIAMVLLVGVTAMLAEVYWRLAVLGLPLWPIALFIFRKDHNGLRVMSLWLRTSALDCYAWWYGGTSLEVFPSTQRDTFRGIPNV